MGGRNAIPGNNTQAGAYTQPLVIQHRRIRGRQFGPLYLKVEARVAHASMKHSEMIINNLLRKGRTGKNALVRPHT